MSKTICDGSAVLHMQSSAHVHQTVTIDTLMTLLNVKVNIQKEVLLAIYIYIYILYRTEMYNIARKIESARAYILYIYKYMYLNQHINISYYLSYY